MRGKKRRYYKASARRIEELGIDTLIIDELTRFKHTSFHGFKILKQVHMNSRDGGADGLARGEPDAGPIRAVLRSRRLGGALGSFITGYRMKYFTPDYGGYDWTIKPELRRKYTSASRRSCCASLKAST